MKTSFWVAVISVLALPTCMAGTSYVITNNDNPNGNSISIYLLNANTGVLTHHSDLPTGGFGEGGGYFSTASAGAVITGMTGCLFAYDTGSSDIAGFTVNLAALQLKQVGNFSNPALIAQFPGGSLALSPNGSFLYATYATSENIGAWAVNSDCSLTFIAAYQAGAGADFYDGIKVTPNGLDLLVSAPDFGAAELFSINQTTGALADLGALYFSHYLSECSGRNSCFPAGIDITHDSKVALFGNYGLSAPSLLAAAIEPKRLKDATYFSLANAAGLSNNATVPFLSTTAYNGSGPLYVGMSGTGAGSQPGVVTASFSEAAKSITVTTATAINSTNQYDGLIAASGNLLIVSEWYNSLQVFTINADGTLTPTSQGPVSNSHANGAYSFFIYPDTR